MKLFRWMKRKPTTRPIPLNGRVLVRREEEDGQNAKRGIVVATSHPLVSVGDRVRYYPDAEVDGYDLVLSMGLHAILPPRAP